MRKVESEQFELGSAPIADITINVKSRDDIPALLLGLQHLYVTDHLREQVFELLEAEGKPNVRKDTGRPGMELWRILVLAIVKQGLNCDFDRLTELANEHSTLRQMMGHGPVVSHFYERQTVVDNVSLLSPQLLVKINQLLVQDGHKVVRKKPWRNIAKAC